MTAQTKSEELAAECIEHFKLTPFELDVHNIRKTINDYLQQKMTQEVALDVVLNFPDKYVDGLYMYNETDGLHPRVWIVDIALKCVDMVIDKMVEKQS